MIEIALAFIMVQNGKANVAQTIISSKSGSLEAEDGQEAKLFACCCKSRKANVT